ncbi:MAG: 2-C-methyl-D-erythritol 2,4-cyclodiphosphate synthase [Planctomycetota bacterium]
MNQPSIARSSDAADGAQVPELPYRIGLGYDSHRLGEGGPLRIGGISIDADVHCIGHSDADVLLHAITDAFLGAIANPDIGRLFPDTAADNQGRDSSEFLAEAVSRVHQAGYQLGNLDAVILAQKPKMAPHIDAMRKQIAQMCGCDIAQVGLKAKTGEGVDAVGRCEAIATRASVLLIRNNIRI